MKTLSFFEITTVFSFNLNISSNAFIVSISSPYNNIKILFRKQLKPPTVKIYTHIFFNISLKLLDLLHLSNGLMDL